MTTTPPDSGWHDLRPRPRDPSVPSKGSRTPTLLILGVLFFVIGGIITFALTYDGPDEDEREIRRFGNLECVYNVDTDEVESCVEVTGEP